MKLDVACFAVYLLYYSSSFLDLDSDIFFISIQIKFIQIWIIRICNILQTALDPVTIEPFVHLKPIYRLDMSVW